MRLWILLAVLAKAAAPAQAPAKPLLIANAGVQQFEDGPPVAEGHQFVAGETVFFSFQVTGYRVSGDRKVQLNYRIQVTDSEGINLVEETSGKLETELAERRQGVASESPAQLRDPPACAAREVQDRSLGRGRFLESGGQSRHSV